MSSLYTIEKIINQKNYRLAINIIEKKITVEPDPLYYYLLGTCYFNINDFQKAYENIKKAVDINPYGSYKNQVFSQLLNEIATSKQVKTDRKKIIIDINDRNSVHSISLYPIADVYFIDNMHLCNDPDYFLVCNWLSPYHPFYEKMETLNYPVISLIVDRLFHAEEHIKSNLIYSDIVVCMENYATDIFKKQGFSNVIYYPCAGSVGYDPLAYPDLNLEKKYDVVFLGNVSDSLMYKKRRMMLDKLESLKDKYKIIIKPVSDYNEYWNLTNSAKIIIDHTIDSRALNYRMFQALGIGSLCFVEENDMVSELYKDKEDIVLYNLENLEFLIDYYINNDDEREKIAKHGQFKTLNYYTHYHMMKGVLEKIESEDFKFPSQKKNFSLEKFLLYKGVTKYYQNKYEEALDIFKLINKTEDAEIVNNIMVQLIKITESKNVDYSNKINEIYTKYKDYLLISLNYMLYLKYVKNINNKLIDSIETMKSTKGLLFLPNNDPKFVENYKVKHGKIIFEYGIDSNEYEHKYYDLIKDIFLDYLM